MPFDQQNFEPTPSDPVLANLMVARTRVALGWCQRKLADDAGRMCALGALRNCQHDLDVGEWSPAIEAAADFVRSALPFGNSIPAYNNHETATHADVLALFDRAIDARKAELLKTNELGAVGALSAA